MVTDVKSCLMLYGGEWLCLSEDKKCMTIEFFAYVFINWEGTYVVHVFYR